jgi:hypothetical protein
MSKHTPGPWTAEEAGRSGCWISTPVHPFTIVDSIDDECRHGAITGPNADANARLIAAAPDLLAALKLAVQQNDHDMQMTGDELRICRAAIAKAEGKQ